MPEVCLSVQDNVIRTFELLQRYTIAVSED